MKSGEGSGYPRFRGRQHYNSFTYPHAGRTGAKPLVDSGKVYLSKIGNVRCKYQRLIEGVIKTATICREGEHWYVVFSCEVEAGPLPVTGRVTGFDLGVNPNFLISDAGEVVRAPKYWRRSKTKLALLQRARSRTKRGSRWNHELRRQARREHQRVPNRRRDFHHKVARQLVNENDVIVHENLQTKSKSMVRGYASGSIHDAGWTAFLMILSYKAEEACRRVVPVNPAFTSQDCSNCGRRQKVPIGRPYECGAYSFTLDRDVNAARNILARGLGGAMDETPLVAAGH